MDTVIVESSAMASSSFPTDHTQYCVRLLRYESRSLTLQQFSQPTVQSFVTLPNTEVPELAEQHTVKRDGLQLSPELVDAKQRHESGCAVAR